MDTINKQILTFDNDYPGVISHITRLLESGFELISQTNSPKFIRLANIYGADVIIHGIGLLKQVQSTSDNTDYSYLTRLIENEDNSNIIPDIETQSQDNTIRNLIFKKFSNDTIHNNNFYFTNPCWSNTSGSITTFFTSSLQTKTEFYYDVYLGNPDLDDTELTQCSVAYGNYYGKGAEKIDVDSSLTSLTPSKVIYSQYNNILPSTTIDRFLNDGKSLDDIFVINFNRNRLKQSLDTYNWELTLTSPTATDFVFIDDSINNTSVVQTDIISFNIVSGSLNGGIYEVDNEQVNYGTVYPLLGILIFDATKLNDNGVLSVTSEIDTNNDNTLHFFNAMQSGSNFLARNSQKLHSLNYSVHVKNTEFNYTFNPSIISGSLGDFRNIEMITDPITYPTTIGLYNDNFDLLAVAKTGIMKRKDFFTEMSYNIKLDF